MVKNSGFDVTYLKTFNKDHFTITADVGQAESPLARAMPAQMEVQDA